MESGPASRSRSSSAQRAGVNVRSKSGRSASDSTRSVSTLRPSSRRFQAASKRSSASRASPTRSATILAKAPACRLDVALEVVAQLFHRAQLVRHAATAHAPSAGLVDHELAVAQPVAQIMVELDAHERIAGHNGL